jgi:CHAD domain-containing protein
MAFQFEAGEAAGEGILRIVAEQIDGAVRELRAETRDPHVRVHEVRKHVKKIRAVLRLVRPALGATYAAENAWYRDTSRQLAAVRDAEALVEACDRLAARFGKEGEPAALAPLAPLREALVRRRDRVAGDAVDLADRMAAMAGALQRTRKRLARWPALGDTFAALAPGLRQTYRWGRKAFAAVRLHEDPPHYHEWRKAVKALLYQGRLFTPAWPMVFTAHVQALDDLAERLGDLNDLDVLRRVLHDAPEVHDRYRAAPALSWMIERHRGGLCREVAALGRRLYAEKPGVFTARVGACWEAWQEEGADQRVLS